MAPERWRKATSTPMHSSMVQSQMKSSFPRERVMRPGNPCSPWPMRRTPARQAMSRLITASLRMNARATARRAGTREVQLGSKAPSGAGVVKEARGNVIPGGGLCPPIRRVRER